MCSQTEPLCRVRFHLGAIFAAPAYKSRCWAGIPFQRRLFHGGAAHRNGYRPTSEMHPLCLVPFAPFAIHMLPY